MGRRAGDRADRTDCYRVKIVLILPVWRGQYTQRQFCRLKAMLISGFIRSSLPRSGTLLMRDAHDEAFVRVGQVISEFRFIHSADNSRCLAANNGSTAHLARVHAKMFTGRNA